MYKWMNALAILAVAAGCGEGTSAGVDAGADAGVDAGEEVAAASDVPGSPDASVLHDGTSGGPDAASDAATQPDVAYDIARTQSRLRAFAAEGAPLVEWLWERLEKGQ